MNDPAERVELIEDTPLMPSLRINDSYIMKEFLDAGVKDNELKILNYMRMSIKAVTISDIATPNGRRITFDAWNLIGSNKLRSEYDWPRRPPNLTNLSTNFTEQQKDIWRNDLHKTFGVPHSGNQCKTIRT